MKPITTEQISRIKQLLSDDRYSTSKDWVNGDLAERVEWLIIMLENTQSQLDQFIDMTTMKNRDHG